MARTPGTSDTCEYYDGTAPCTNPGVSEVTDDTRAMPWTICELHSDPTYYPGTAVWNSRVVWNSG